MKIEPPLTHWIDTCVMLDFDTTITMSKNMHQGLRSILETRRAMQRAAWMAMACDELGVVSVTFAHEAQRKMLEEAPPSTVEGQWTYMIMHIVRPYACPRWHVWHTNEGRTIMTPEGERPADTDTRDQFMVDASKRNGLEVITSDGGALKRARRAGVKASRPDEFASRVIAFETARDRFMERLDLGIRAFLARDPEEHSYDDANVIWESYEALWDDELRCR